MAREKKQQESDEPAGAPEWMVTFSDCMTLLLTFFVLLLSFSSFDERTFKRLNVIYSDAFSTIHPRRRATQDALVPFEPIKYTAEIERGSEKPTLEQAEQGRLKETQPEDFRRHKVFLASSDSIFWGTGTAVSSNGRKILSTMAEFLKEIPSRVVISENVTGNDSLGEQLGPLRAWAIINFLTEKQKLSKDRFSMSVGSLVGKKGSEIFKLDHTAQPDRILEIVILDRSIYN